MNGHSIVDLGELHERILVDRSPRTPVVVISAGTCGQASGSNDLIRIAKRKILANGIADRIRLRITGCHGFSQAEPSVVIEPAGTFYPQLGMGDEVWAPQSRLRIKLGPLSLKQYLDFLPTGTAYAPLQAIARFFSGDELDFEVQLILKREEAPSCELGTERDVAPPLGWVNWAKIKPMYGDPADTLLRL